MTRRVLKRAPLFDGGDALDVGFRIKLAQGAVVGHVTDLAVHRPLRPPGAIVFADDRSGDSGVTVGVAPVELVTIVETYRDIERFSRRRTPLENFLGPIHAQVAMHPAGQHHLFLRRVPERVMGFGIFQLRFAVNISPLILGMNPQRSVGPRLARIEAVVAAIVTDEIDRQLATHDELFEKRLAIFRRRIGMFHGQRHFVGADLSEVQIGRKLAGAVDVGMIALGGIARKSRAEESDNVSFAAAARHSTRADGIANGLRNCGKSAWIFGRIVRAA